MNQAIEDLMNSVSSRDAAGSGWHKLGVREKRRHLAKYAQSYCDDRNLGPVGLEALEACLRTGMKRNRFEKASDVVYDKSTGVILDLPTLVYNGERTSFMLARNESRKRATDSLPV